MTDIVDKSKRSEMMSGIRGRDTTPEMMVRKALHGLGYRYRLHDKRLPGKPDIVLPRYRAIIEVNGCFWHGHDCHLMKWPSTRPEFWKEKINSNAVRDAGKAEQWQAAGWRVCVIWECALKGRARRPFPEAIAELEKWLRSDESFFEIVGLESGKH